MAKNVIIGQSGGPTAVINSSLAGVYKAACSLGADKVYGMKYGIEGLLKEEMLELNVLLDDRMSIELLKRTPSSYLGSCRYKLPDPDVDSAPFIKLFTLFDKYDICAVFYIGGNDSMDTIAKLSRYGAQVGSAVRFIGVPKTIDNDLCLTDHTGRAAALADDDILGHENLLVPFTDKLDFLCAAAPLRAVPVSRSVHPAQCTDGGTANNR